ARIPGLRRDLLRLPQLLRPLGASLEGGARHARVRPATRQLPRALRAVTARERVAAPRGAVSLPGSQRAAGPRRTLPGPPRKAVPVMAERGGKAVRDGVEIV